MGHVYHPKFIEIVHAPDFIEQSEKPQVALQRDGLSISVAAQLVRDGRADALVSAGNTGGVILASSSTFERIKGVRRVGFAAVLPTEKKRGRRKDPFALLMDVGATLHVESQDLYNFALMGSLYASIVSSNEQPSIALLSNGSESGKGLMRLLLHSND